MKIESKLILTVFLLLIIPISSFAFEFEGLRIGMQAEEAYEVLKKKNFDNIQFDKTYNRLTCGTLKKGGSYFIPFHPKNHKVFMIIYEKRFKNPMEASEIKGNFEKIVANAQKKFGPYDEIQNKKNIDGTHWWASWGYKGFEKFFNAESSRPFWHWDTCKLWPHIKNEIALLFYSKSYWSLIITQPSICDIEEIKDTTHQ